MELSQIAQLQKENGLEEIQELINSGLAWKLEGHVGRTAMSLLEDGACMLPENVNYDVYGNRMASRNDLEAGSKGTLLNCENFWNNVLNGNM